MQRNELRQQIEGAPPRDLSMYAAWRKGLRPENLKLMGFYGTYLMGQYSGMGYAMSLSAIQAAFELDGVPRDQWADLSQRLLFLHSLVVSALPKESK